MSKIDPFVPVISRGRGVGMDHVAQGEGIGRHGNDIGGDKIRLQVRPRGIGVVAHGISVDDYGNCSHRFPKLCDSGIGRQAGKKDVRFVNSQSRPDLRDV
jgi:hypothetical protein